MFSEIVLKARIYVMGILKNLENDGYVYHNLSHTMDVFERADYLCQKEWVNDDLAELVHLWALFHDTWFTKVFNWDEKVWVEIFEDWISQYYPDYPMDRINIISWIILATDIYTQPENKLQEIIKDADIDSLGRSDFFEKWKLLKEEYKNKWWIDYSDRDRIERNQKLLNTVKFYTKTSIWERAAEFKQNLETLEKMLKML